MSPIAQRDRDRRSHQDQALSTGGGTIASSHRTSRVPPQPDDPKASRRKYEEDEMTLPPKGADRGPQNFSPADEPFLGRCEGASSPSWTPWQADAGWWAKAMPVVA